MNKFYYFNMLLTSDNLTYNINLPTVEDSGGQKPRPPQTSSTDSYFYLQKYFKVYTCNVMHYT